MISGESYNRPYRWVKIERPGIIKIGFFMAIGWKDTVRL